MKDFRPKDWPLSKRLLATVAYFDVFELPVAESHLSALIWGDAGFNLLELEVAMTELEGALERRDGFLFLSGRAHLIAGRQERERLQTRLLKKAKHIKWLLRTTPFVEFVAVCNYLPLGVVEENSDIDLLVVTTPGRIFSARLLLTIFFQIVGMRRHADKVEGRFCLSFYLNRHSLSLERLLIKPNDFYMAYWMLALWPLYGDKSIYQEMMRENEKWLQQYFSGTLQRGICVQIMQSSKKSAGKNLVGKLMEFLLRRRIGDAFEKGLKKYFLKRHARNIEYLPENASVEVSDERLKFHNNDKRQYFREEFEKRLERLQLL